MAFWCQLHVLLHVSYPSHPCDFSLSLRVHDFDWNEPPEGIQPIASLAKTRLVDFLYSWRMDSRWLLRFRWRVGETGYCVMQSITPCRFKNEAFVWWQSVAVEAILNATPWLWSQFLCVFVFQVLLMNRMMKLWRRNEWCDDLLQNGHQRVSTLKTAKPSLAARGVTRWYFFVICFEHKSTYLMQ